MKCKVVVESIIDDGLWGWSDLLEDCGGFNDEFKKAMIELILEDICALIEDARWHIELIEDCEEKEMADEAD